MRLSTVFSLLTAAILGFTGIQAQDTPQTNQGVAVTTGSLCTVTIFQAWRQYRRNAQDGSQAWRTVTLYTGEMTTGGLNPAWPAVQSVNFQNLTAIDKWEVTMLSTGELELKDHGLGPGNGYSIRRNGDWLWTNNSFTDGDTSSALSFYRVNDALDTTGGPYYRMKVWGDTVHIDTDLDLNVKGAGRDAAFTFTC